VGLFSLASSIGAVAPTRWTAKITSADVDVSSAQATLAASIRGVGTGGDSREQPLCSMTRIIDSGVFAPGDRAAFVVISDEDDGRPARRALSTGEGRSCTTWPEVP
jgi:hypothetical protein